MSANRFRITTSWDDGHPADARVADLLAKYGIAGTFYVPSRNSEGRPVMSPGDIRTLAAGFEIGGHTRDHTVLTTLSASAAREQISANKRSLEDLLSKPVVGFAYPRGKHNAGVRRAVADEGFRYARTVKNLCTGTGDDPFAVPTTLQFFPHPTSVYARNLVRQVPTRTRAQLMLAAAGDTRISERVKRAADFCRASNGTFHLWGHSWELEEGDMWTDLEDALSYLSSACGDAQHLPNGDVIRH